MDQKLYLHSDFFFDRLLNIHLELLNCTFFYLSDYNILHVMGNNICCLILNLFAHIKVNFILDHLFNYRHRLILNLLINEQLDLIFYGIIHFLSDHLIDCGIQVVLELVLDYLLDAFIHLLDLNGRRCLDVCIYVRINQMVDLLKNQLLESHDNLRLNFSPNDCLKL